MHPHYGNLNLNQLTKTIFMVFKLNPLVFAGLVEFLALPGVSGRSRGWRVDPHFSTIYT